MINNLFLKTMLNKDITNISYFIYLLHPIHSEYKYVICFIYNLEAIPRLHPEKYSIAIISVYSEKLS